MRHTDDHIDPDGLIRPLESYAVVALLGCGTLCIALVVIGLIAWGIIAWL